MRKGQIARVMITLFGIILILFAMTEVFLGFVGESTSAHITNIRREGGEREEAIPGRYTYNISYSFTLPDGQEASGFTKKIGSALFIKPDGTSRIQVRYLPSLPWVNTLEENTGVGARQFALIGAGGALIYLMNFYSRRAN